MQVACYLMLIGSTWQTLQHLFEILFLHVNQSLDYKFNILHEIYLFFISLLCPCFFFSNVCSLKATFCSNIQPFFTSQPIVHVAHCGPLLHH
jgi:hypothetical protein